VAPQYAKAGSVKTINSVVSGQSRGRYSETQ
jgi:hypothetical protein